MFGKVFNHEESQQDVFVEISQLIQSVLDGYKPNLTLSLSSHSDLGEMTLLLSDDQVTCLQVRKDDRWITVKLAKHAFIVNIGNQIQTCNLQLEFLDYYLCKTCEIFAFFGDCLC